MDTLIDIREWLIYLYESNLFTPKQLYFFLADRRECALANAINRLLARTQRQMVFAHWRSTYSMSYFEAVYTREHIHPITILDENYPVYLREIYQPPPVIFVQGECRWLDMPSLAVVGCREATNYGISATNQLIPELSKQVPIVSGLARGIDDCAHRAAINSNGKTIAVIGTGLANCYPKEHSELQHMIRRDHCLVSPLPYHAGPRRYHFPFRNQVIAGLAVGTLVVEAKVKSGSLITANYALQYNREVIAVPGRILDSPSEGCNSLLQAGATPILSAKDIFTALSSFLNV